MPATARYPRVRTEGGMRDNTILVVPYSTIGNAMTPIANVPGLQGRLSPLTFRVWGTG